ncbi:DUF4386 domain-containing protein [Protaetiibacter mangrovi]|uniref:DUF4386 domain-containing protein n=1 Tax=Protaetiibacter mangrovi TaxID=2970926 RepID=A0ABT1ZHM5_9MICO|nr:DUF4386 domain-containing protein [Protaetiibacter mangrovi]MCS0500206.1 DUF4386 domain-containing protein [Protaetiibacter mangrovi]TPX03558.1 DUF4386 domain-containing protein [Schumannella luteola]
MTPPTVARSTGAAYLALALTGMAGHLVLRGMPGYAELALLAELLVVVSQALAAWGFFALFRRDHPTAAWGVASFGLANAIVILGSAGFLAVALAVGADPALAPGGDVEATVALLRALSDAGWQAGAVFFGLWLVPMGVFAITTRLMPRALGWALVVGGAGYVLAAVLGVVEALAPVADALAYLATVGELWMIGYLLTVGIRRTAPASGPVGG